MSYPRQFPGLPVVRGAESLFDFLPADDFAQFVGNSAAEIVASASAQKVILSHYC
jgi:hypothetical protein